MSTNKTKAALFKELTKWEVNAQKLKTSASISYGKIKGYLAVLETSLNREESNKMSSSIGKITINFLINNLQS